MKTLTILAFAAALASGSALASPCSDKIADLQKRSDAAPIVQGAAPAPAPTGATGAAETVSAKLHHQPAPASPADAADPALSPASIRDARFKNEIERAQAALHSGDEANCEAAAARAGQALAH